MNSLDSAKVGAYYQHCKKGTEYQVVYVANTAGDRRPITVVYVDSDDDVWARPLDEWEGRYQELV